MDASKIITRLEGLKSERTLHDAIWRECFDLTYPLRGSGFNGVKLTAQQGADRNADNLDSTATDSVRVLASSMQSGATPANSLWFGLDAGNESEEEKYYLSEAAQVLWENIHMSNFDSVGYESLIDMVAAGWFAMYIGEDSLKGGLSFEGWPLAQCYCTSTNAKGTVDTVYRDYKLSASQAMNQFKQAGDELPESITLALSQNKPDMMFNFIHCVEPRSTYMVNAKMAKNMPIASCHVEVESKKVVRESGYQEMPVIVPRWMMIPGTAYAVGPVYDALADIRELNALKRLDKMSAEINIAGMWIAENDGVLNPTTIKVGPRKVIVANSVDSMKELKTSANWQLADERISQLQNSIRKILMANHLEPQDGPVISATEAHINVNLIRQLLGPVFGRMQSEYLQPLIERCFGIAYRAGALGEAPASLINREFHVRYLSPLARAQKLEDVTAIERLNNNIGQIVAIDQTIVDNIDFDEQARVLAEALGVPVKTMRKKVDVDTLRQKRNEAMQEQQQQAMVQQLQAKAGEAAINTALQPKAA